MALSRTATLSTIPCAPNARAIPHPTRGKRNSLSPRPAPATAPATAPAPAPVPSPAPPAPTPDATTGRRAPAVPGALLPAPAAGNAFYPALLPYRPGLPVPPGYRVEHRPATGMIIGGLATLGIAYSTALVIGASANFGDGTGWLGIPVIGPWAAIGARSYHCGNDPLQANKCISGAFSEVQTIAVLSADGVIQAAGAVLFVVGLASGHDEPVRTDLPVSFRVL